MRKFSKDDQAALALWALGCAERVHPLFERVRPDDGRPRRAIEVGREWASTRVFSMAAIRSASLSAHAAARDAAVDAPACQAAHAAGQAVATAHVPQHAYGGAYYALRALVAESPGAAEAVVRDELAWQSAHLPDHLRDEVMGRLMVEPRRTGLHVGIDKGRGF